jgi:hypothetical protein
MPSGGVAETYLKDRGAAGKCYAPDCGIDDILEFISDKKGGINAEGQSSIDVSSVCIKVTNNDKLIQVDMDRIVESEV